MGLAQTTRFMRTGPVDGRTLTLGVHNCVGETVNCLFFP